MFNIDILYYFITFLICFCYIIEKNTFFQEVKLMKKTKKKVVNIQEYKEKRKQKEVDRNELIALIKQIATLKQGELTL